MSNKTGVLTHVNKEWGSKARKRADEQHGLNNSARQQQIAEQIADLTQD